MKSDKVILGQGAEFTTDSDVTGINNNIIVCGGSGSGKTMSITEPRLLETHNSSLIVTVTKRRIADRYKALFRSRGYNVDILDFTRPGGSTVAYDPLAYIECDDDIQFLAQSIIAANPKRQRANNDPYWEEAAVSLLCAEIAYVMIDDDSATFDDVLRLHDSLAFWSDDDEIGSSLDEKFDSLNQKRPGCYAVNRWNSFRRLPMRTASCVYSTLNAAIANVFTSNVRETIRNRKPISYVKLGSSKTVLFVISSAVNPALHYFVNMFYAQTFKSLFEYAEECVDGVLPVPVHVICDDFATGGKVANFAEYISIFREKGISVTLLVQSESQLESIYDSSEATTIINNCDTYVYMGGMDLKTGKSVCERLNKPLDEVLYMPVGKEYVFRRGQKPIQTCRYDISSNRLYRSLTGRTPCEDKKSADKKSEQMLANGKAVG